MFVERKITREYGMTKNETEMEKKSMLEDLTKEQKAKTKTSQRVRRKCRDEHEH